MTYFDGEGCAFNKCPVSDEIIEVSGPCREQRGAKCGPVVAYEMLHGKFAGLEELDYTCPIAAQFEIDHVPDGSLPIEVREAWVGVPLPVRKLPRQEERLEEGTMAVTRRDGILSLLAHGKLDAAMLLGDEEDLGEIMVFREFEGKLKPLLAPPMSSDEFYGSRLDETTRQLIQEDVT